MRRTVWLGGAVFVLVVVAFAWFQFGGRTPSRLLGKGARQVLDIKDMQKFISISYDKRGSSTVKDVTYLAGDGYVYTQEYKDVSPLKGSIRWVPHDHSESFIQSRGISRWTGASINLRLPEDCAQVLGVDVTSQSDEERSKMLTYLSKDGKILSKEYLEGFWDRNFEGWLEVKTAG